MLHSSESTTLRRCLSQAQTSSTSSVLPPISNLPHVPDPPPRSSLPTHTSPSPYVSPASSDSLASGHLRTQAPASSMSLQMNSVARWIGSNPRSRVIEAPTYVRMYIQGPCVFLRSLASLRETIVASALGKSLSGLLEKHVVGGVPGPLALLSLHGPQCLRHQVLRPMRYPMLRDSDSGLETGFPGSISAGFQSGKLQNLPSGRPTAGQRAEFDAAPETKQ